MTLLIWPYCATPRNVICNLSWNAIESVHHPALLRLFKVNQSLHALNPNIGFSPFLFSHSKSSRPRQDDASCHRVPLKCLFFRPSPSPVQVLDVTILFENVHGMQLKSFILWVTALSYHVSLTLTKAQPLDLDLNFPPKQCSWEWFFP